MTLSWIGNQSLLIEYDEADIDYFTNYYHPYEPKDFSYKVNITEICRKEIRSDLSNK